MEKIRAAVEIAKGGGVPKAPTAASVAAASLRGLPEAYANAIDNQHEALSFQEARSEVRAEGRSSKFKRVILNSTRLEDSRIIGHDIQDPRAKSYDMLRTQVLQSMDRQSRRFLAITSPSANCGKTITASNLALSIARHSERSVLLVDLDLQKPHVGGYFGINTDAGLLAAIEGRISLADAMVEAQFGANSLLILPIEHSTQNSSEWIASRAMGDLLVEIRRQFATWTVIFDLPPMLLSDEVLTILPQMDCVILVAGVGTTTKSEIAECNKHLHSTDVVRLVLNKVPRTTKHYYY